MAKRAKKLSDDEKKEELLSELVEVRGRILREASALSPDHDKEIFLGTWSIRELLAHLAGWDVTNLNAARSILRGELPKFYAEYDRDWKSYNARLVEKYNRDDIQELLSLVEETHKELLVFLRDLPASEIFKDRGIRSKGYKVTLGRLLQVEMKDEETHHSQIREFVESLHLIGSP
jgi:hypothetical protein